jgi:hypothetical protein
MDDLIGRFEEPVATRRWDNPLFVVTPDDELPLEEINQALFHGKAVKPSLATQVVRPFVRFLKCGLNLCAGGVQGYKLFVRIGSCDQGGYENYFVCTIFWKCSCW